MSNGPNKVNTDETAEKYAVADTSGDVENQNKTKINIVDSHAIKDDNDGLIAADPEKTPEKNYDTDDSRNNDSVYSTDDWDSSQSTRQFIAQNTLYKLSKQESDFHYMIQMLSGRGKLLLYGVALVLIAAVLVRLTLDGNSVAGLFLDLFNRTHQGAIVFISWHYYMPSRFSKRFLLVMASAFIFIYAFFHVVNFAIDPQNYTENRIYDANDYAATFFRCQVKFGV